MEFRKHSGRFLRHTISLPFAYMLIIPLVALDIFVEIYKQTCFRLYGIKMIRRKDFIRIDRPKLRYLDLAEKINCAYCSYANGLLNYSAAIAAETEKYWCGIKHRKYKGFKAPAHHKDFLEYGDEKGLRKKFG